MAATDTPTADTSRHLHTPTMPCDVVMKGGITSGVVYPRALSEIGATYRLRGLGGASAGAIGATLGAAAEFGRQNRGFERLEELPAKLGDGQLARLFQAQQRTRPLLRLMLTATSHDRKGAPRKGVFKVIVVLVALLRAFPYVSMLGMAPGVGLVVSGAFTSGAPRILLIVAGIVLLPLSWIVGVALRLTWKLTVNIPQNLFGICRGLGSDQENPGFTGWLSTQIDEVAGLQKSDRPLRFGQLWSGTVVVESDNEAERYIDLRMISTCLSQGRPYELPWSVHSFFYAPEIWKTLFPEDVMTALETAPEPSPPPGRENETAEWRWEEDVAAAQSPALKRFPDPGYWPVIVATRMSLSFPLLISAIPVWTIDRLNKESREATDRFRAGRPAVEGLEFAKLWFTDGGLCSNFPIHLFDAALPSWPTFAINLGQFAEGQDRSENQTENVELARSNSPLSTSYVAIPESGFGAIGRFATAAINTARGWQDASQLGFPGFRDRIVRVLQTRDEGGLNLHMDAPTIGDLADRGQVAGRVIVDQFTQPHYPHASTGWDNHRWVRYRALLSVLPAWLTSYERGRRALDINEPAPPSYRLSPEAMQLATSLARAMDTAAAVVATAATDTLQELTSAPRPNGMIRRIPNT